MPSVDAGRLPSPLVPLIGRERELREVSEILPGCRLLDLTGPGGTGKTRLAIEVAKAALGAFDRAVYWVELAPIANPALVDQAVAATLGVPEDPDPDRAAAIIDHLGERRALIVLDNCEHLAESAAVLTERLLSGCPGLVILATSRELLGVDGERNWPVPPLSLPPRHSGTTAASLTSSGAVTLFCERARMVLPSFEMTDRNAGDIAAICRRLDGLPLAIELAAARLRTLTPRQLAERLGDMFAVLTGGARTAPARHQTLRATLDWSHDLLTGSERAVLRRLAVFAGGFTLEAAEQVAGADDIPPGQILDLMTRLADRSLLRADVSDGYARYHLLATVQDYARGRLAEAGELERARRDHLSYYAGLIEQAEPRLAGGVPPEAAGGVPPEAAGGVPSEPAGGLERELDRLEAETPNLRAALEFAGQIGDGTSALRITGPLARYAYLRGHYHEVRQWLDSAVTAGADAPAGLRAKALLGSGRLAHLQCDYVPAIRRLEAALRLYRDLEDPQGLASTLQVLGSVAREQGRYARSRELHAEGLAIAEAAGDSWAIATAHGYLGFATWLQGDFEQATADCAKALGIFRQLGDVEGSAWSLISLGTIARYQGQIGRAAELLAESRALCERIGFREGIAWSLEQLGLLALASGGPPGASGQAGESGQAGTGAPAGASGRAAASEAAGASGMLRRSLDLHRDLQDRWRTNSLLEDLAELAFADGQADRAARLLGAAEAGRTAIGTVIALCDAAQHERTQALARQALGAGAFDAAWQEGLRTSLDDLLAEPAAPDRAQAPETGPAAVGADRATIPRTSAARRPPRPAGEPGPAALAGAPLRITTLGAATVHRGETLVTAADWGYAKPRELLFLLATSPPLSRDRLGAALWPDADPGQLTNSLHTALRELRRALGDPAWVRYRDGSYEFNSELEHFCDVTVFEQALAEARRARPAAAALPHLRRAIAAYGGDFLEGLAAGDWAEPRRRELRRAFESALLAAGRLHAAAGEFRPAAAVLQKAIDHEPLSEVAHRELMTCWARMGETARAIAHYHEVAALLNEQVGVAPAAETTALYQRLLGQRQPG